MESLHRAVEALHGASVNGVEKRALIGGDHVDQMEVLRLLVRVRLGVLHSILGRIDIAPAHRHIRAQKRQRIVQNLLLHGVVDLAHFDDRVGRAGIGSWRHGCDVRSFHKEKAG